MELKISGLKCDYCDWRDNNISFNEYEKYINYKCPKCGKIVLTQEEYNGCLKAYKIVDIYNKISNNLKWVNPLYYWRLLFGDNRPIYKYKADYPKRLINIGVICYDKNDFLDNIKKINNIKIINHKKAILNNKTYIKISRVEDLCSITLDEIVVTDEAKNNIDFQTIVQISRMQLKSNF